jgi:ERCC4-type nuclease
MKNCLVKIDSREPAWIQKLQWDGALTAVETLPVGDIVVHTPAGLEIVVERKSPADFLQSIADGRLLNQAAELGKLDWGYMLVGGAFFPAFGRVAYWENGKQQETNWDWNPLQGALLSVQELGVPVVYDSDVAGAIARLVARGRDSHRRIKPRTTATLFSPAEKIVAALPGIGEKRALQFLDQMVNPAGVITVLTATNQGIPGWGEKSRQNLINVLGAPMTIVTPDIAEYFEQRGNNNEMD